MTKMKFLAGLLAISASSAALYAAPGMKADTNGDNAVTKTEAMAAADKRFAKMDANSDGVLNDADRVAKVKMRFARLDADKNGSVTEAEFVASHEARADNREDRREKRMSRGGGESMMGRQGGRRSGGMKMMAKADTNGDKVISAAEFRTAAEARFTKADANGDGTITADERKAGRKGNWGDRRPAAPAEAN